MKTGLLHDLCNTGAANFKGKNPVNEVVTLIERVRLGFA